MIRFGILGAGNIAHRFSASLAQEPRAQLVAASCRSTEKAEAFLGEVPHAQGARAYGSYEQLLSDREVDAIYLALPHAYHKEWAIRALEANKSVLCEKPAMLDANDMREVAAVARKHNVLFMEAMKPRFTPLYARVMAAIDQLGPIAHVEATLCNDMLADIENSGTYHMAPGAGSGVLLDCGTYCASWVAAFCPGKLEVLSATGEARNGVDIYVDAQLSNGVTTARLECAFDRAKPRTATLVGSHGRMVVDELHRPQFATLYVEGEEPQVFDVPYEVDDFYGEIHHFVDLCESGANESPIMSLDDSIACATVLDLVRSAIAAEE